MDFVFDTVMLIIRESLKGNPLAILLGVALVIATIGLLNSITSFLSGR